MGEWPLRCERNKFSQLINAAGAGEPQIVTRRGQPAVVILAIREYERLPKIEECHVPSLNELLLEILQDGQEFERSKITPRAI